MTIVTINTTMAFHGGFDNNGILAVVERLKLAAERLEGIKKGDVKGVQAVDLNTPRQESETPQ